jgi:hypothetical protein
MMNCAKLVWKKIGRRSNQLVFAEALRLGKGEAYKMVFEMTRPAEDADSVRAFPWVEAETVSA